LRIRISTGCTRAGDLARAGLCCLLLLAAAPLATEGTRPPVPFGLGERITFKVGWGLINAGTSWLEVMDTVRVDGRSCWKLHSRAKTNDFLSALYPVDDRVISFMDREGLFSRGIEKHLREGRFKRDRTLAIRPEAQEMLRLKGEEVEQRAELDRFVQDVLSAFYWVRTQPLEVGRVLYVEAVDNMKTYSLAVKVLARERVRVKAGEFDCFKIQPILLGEGLFKSKGEIIIWITADERRIPVKMKSKIFIGSIKALMVEYRPPFDLQGSTALP